MEKINIAELLKNCPKGMELDCTIYNGKVYFDGFDYDNIAYPIKISINSEFIEHLNIYGQYNTRDYAKCVILPKGKTTWEGFVPPCKFKDGDIVYTRGDDGAEYIFIFENITKDTCVNSYLHLKGDELRIIKVWLTNCDDKYLRLATEEEKQKLFQAIKDNGYKWNKETKTLGKLVEPKFKLGDRIRLKNGGSIVEVTSINNDSSICINGMSWTIKIEQQDNYELAPNKFDITTLVPFESKVLVRDSYREKWKSNFWGFYDDDHIMNYPYECCGASFAQCIPYEGNEHLLGKIDDCDEFYKNWI